MSETARETMSEATSQAMSEAGEGTNRKDRAKSDGFNWGTAIAMGLFHVGAIAALFLLHLERIFRRRLPVVGFGKPRHRHELSPPADSPRLQNAQVDRVLPHLVRHAGARRRSDFLGGHAPHPSSVFRRRRRSALPIDGKWWSHMGWILMGKSMHHDTTTLARYVPDLTKDKVHVWLTKYHWTSNVIVGIILYAIGGLPWLLWGVFARVVFNLHATWMVNSITHMWGTRRFATKDLSTNNFWWRFLRGAKAGTTIIMRIRFPRVMAWRGTKST